MALRRRSEDELNYKITDSISSEMMNYTQDENQVLQKLVSLFETNDFVYQLNHKIITNYQFGNLIVTKIEVSIKQGPSEYLDMIYSIIRDFPFLLELKLYGEYFSYLPENILEHTKYIRSFSISNTKINHIPKNLFIQNTYLYSIIIKNNKKLNNLPDNLFLKSNLITTLGLNSNNLRDLPLNMLDKQKNLDVLVLDLSGNLLSKNIINHFKNYCSVI
ncbi:MAG: hypothetical protein INQ03_14090 [Candidatus Heimdallarchaeota archaeon]|nr:hypothetical protein [Candidatus Heimdallarchaeota archaeon]